MFMAVIYFWVRSYGSADYLAYCQDKRELGLISTVGHVIMYDEDAIPPFRWGSASGWECDTTRAPDSIESYVLPNQPRKRSFLGFTLISGNNGRYTATARIIPFWSLALLASILPVLWLRRRIRQLQASDPFLCQTCGYDLRGTPDRCPECGKVPGNLA